MANSLSLTWQVSLDSKYSIVLPYMEEISVLFFSSLAIVLQNSCHASAHISSGSGVCVYCI